jgi:anti-sigma factor RsiW
MKSIPGLERLREASWRRKLTPEEEAQLQSLLAADPEAQADWRAEAALNETLEHLPSAPVPSNFTARVLQGVHRESRAVSRRRRPQGWALFHWRLRWLPRAAIVILMLGGGLVTYKQHDIRQRREAMAESVVSFSELRAVVTPEVLENFDAIQAMSQNPSADEDLIRLLK